MTPRAQATIAVLALLAAGPVRAAHVKPVHFFVNTGKTKSHYGLGSSPYGELVQASDGNFYGTTVYGGAGLCPNKSQGGILGCGTVFRMTAAGDVITLYSFPYDTKNGSAADGAFPTAGLIQGKDGFLYGVAQDGGLPGCNGALGCGTAFRVSLAGVFTRLHQFAGSEEGGRPYSHLVQASGGTLYGVANQGGIENEGTLYSMSVSGVVSVLHQFDYTVGNDGYAPVGALLVGSDGKTLYGTTEFGGPNGNASGGGIVFSYAGGTLTTLHAFDNIENTAPGTFFEPLSALIQGPDGTIWGASYSGGAGGGLFSVAPDGTGFTVHYVFSGSPPYDGEAQVGGPIFGSDGRIYGISLLSSQGAEFGNTYSYDPVHGTMRTLAPFSFDTGGNPQGSLIEGSDLYLYGTTSLYGPGNHRGTGAGSAFRIEPALKH